MGNKIATIGAVVALVVVVAIAAAVFMGQQPQADDDRVTFLIEDQYGVYVWIDGNGATVQDAFADAMKDFGYRTTDYVLNDYGVSELFGQSFDMDADMNYLWWGQFAWQDGKWTYLAETSMPEIDSKTLKFFGLFFGKGTMDGMDVPADAPTPKDAKVWDKSKKGTVFTIESPSGMYLRINGEGKTVQDAWKSMCAKYLIPYEALVGTTGEHGVRWMFNENLDQDEGTMTYWLQFCGEGGGWVESEHYMAESMVADNPSFCLLYGVYGVDYPSAPIN